MACLHELIDRDTHYTIDPITMTISNANHVKNMLQLGDHDSEIYTFDAPKEFDGHDLSLCNHVRVHYINISASNKSDQSKDVFEVVDMNVSEDDPEKLVFSWKVSGNATKYAGNLNFRILFACTDENSNFTYKKWTDVFKDISIKDGFDNSEAVVEAFSDILEQWEKNLEEAASNGGGGSFSGSAKDVTYDDTNTKLGATNVQEAIGKVSEQIEALIVADEEEY